MFFSDSLSRTLSALVHPDRRDDPAQHVRHRLFIGARLSLSLAALSGVPVALAFSGAPSGPVAVAFACLLGPLAGAVVASRTGSLALAQALHLSGLFCAIAALTISGAAPGALVWLLLAPLEAGFSSDRRAPLATALASALAAIGFAAAGGRAPSLMQAALFVAPATLYAAAIVWAQREAQAADARVACADHGRYQDLADALGDLVLGCDRSGSVTFACAQEAQAFGLAQRDLAGRGFFERLHIQDRPAYLAAVAQAASGDRTVITLVRLRAGATAADGAAFDAPSYSHVELRCKAARSSDGADVIVVARDVSAARALEGELATLRAQAEGASVWKDRFLANVGHELRTPLNAVIGFSDILRTGAAPIGEARRIEYAGIIHDSGQHLLSIVNSLLDVSKIVAGRFELQPEQVRLPGVIEQVMEMMRLRAEQGGVSLRATIHPLAAELYADKRACRQIITNLVSNAVKFTGEGGAVELLARPEGNSVAIEVIDTGCGIASADLARLGDAFFQASSSYDRTHEGTGLGLSLVRGLVGLHGGAIAIESAPGQGTRVVVTLPLDCRAAATNTAPPRIETAPRRVAAFDVNLRPGAASALDLFRKAG